MRGAIGGSTPAVGDDVSPAAAVPEPERMSTAGDAFAQVLASMRQIVGPVEAEVEPAGGPASVGAAPEADAGPSAASAASGGDGVSVPAPAAPAAPGGRDRSGSSVTALLELGIPTRLVSGFTDPDAAVPLSLLVRRFERAPAARLLPGAVIAVVGPAQAALRTATQMAHRAGLDPHDVVLAGDIEPVPGHGRRLQSAAAVSRFRSRAPDDVPSVVVVAVGQGRDARAAAADLIDALAPDDSWAVVDARLKAVELRRWLRAVGVRRPFDALAATSTFEAQAPGTVLNLGVPVGWVDGLPASPVVWAAVLSERLADDARWD
ncbi:MAG: hypothetical protein HGA44_12025 [Cellulomonadaceae bacterium]|nr:hypothetical protein [Cellulomonadaceae bacterium]